LQLPLGQPDIQRGFKMRRHLGREALHVGQRGKVGDLSAFKIQVVASEDISEQVRFQKSINGGRKCKDRPGHRFSRQLRLNLRSQLHKTLIFRKGTGRLADVIPDALLFPFLHYFHKGADGVQAAGESRIGVKLNQDFLDFIDGQTGRKSRIQGMFQFLRLAAGGKGRNGDNRFLPGIQPGVNIGLCRRNGGRTACRNKKSCQKGGEG